MRLRRTGRDAERETQPMKYDFTTIMDRRGKDAIAVDEIPFENVEVKRGI